MTVGAGRFKLYNHIDPVLSAGDYRYVAAQTLDGDGGDAASMSVATHHAHVRVRAPRYQLPPDQVLSTFPPAAAEGSFGSRLPQIVIRRRTLPWERDLAGQPSTTPWLALVVIAEGEAELKLNEPVADCVTPGVTLEGVADSKLGNALHVRRSVVHQVFPTRVDIPLLAHAREVDINDTELMMGDDDGFLSVVVANRLPLAGVDGAGNEQPVKYLACLVNLEGQFDALLPESPARRVTTAHPVVLDAAVMSVAEHDLQTMQIDSSLTLAGRTDGAGGPAPQALAGHQLGEIAASSVTSTGAAAYSGDASWTLDDAELVATTAYAEMARDFTGNVAYIPELFDPMLRFPVLLHWSFVSVGSTTFKQLMQELDSGLIGTVDTAAAAPEGREPLEVVETGHVGLVHRTRRGDRVRSWYRGPLVPHPPDGSPSDSPEGNLGRLPLAHVADQLRTVIPDGREDLSLAAAFEIGRLLALAHPSMVAALLAWRQTNYFVARRDTIWGQFADFFAEIAGEPLAEVAAVGNRFGLELGRGLMRKVSSDPDEMIGSPRPLFDPGRPLTWERPAAEVVAAGFGLTRDAFSGDLAAVLTKLKQADRLPGETPDIKLGTAEIRDQLHRVVDQRLVDLVSDTLALDIDVTVAPGGEVVTEPGEVVTGPGEVVTGPALDPTIIGPTVPGTILRGTIRPLAERFAAFRVTAADVDVDESDDTDLEDS